MKTYKTISTFMILIMMSFSLLIQSTIILNATSIQNGKTIAAKLCSSCHSISKTDDSINKKAPPFRTFSERWPLENLEEALAEGIVVGHDQMPEFKFTPEQIDDFLAFLSSLNSKAKQ